MQSSIVSRLAFLFTALLLSHFTYAQDGIADGSFPLTSNSAEAAQLLRKSYVAGFIQNNVLMAKNLAKQAVEKDPEFPMAIAVWANMYEDNAETKAQMNEKLKGLTANVSDSEKKLIELLCLPEDDPKVAVINKELATLHPNVAVFSFNLAQTYMAEQKVDEAISLLNNLTNTIPNVTNTYNMLGYAYMEKQDMENARLSFDKFLELNPNNANAYDSKGDYYMAMKDFKSAAESFDKALQLNPELSQTKEKAEKAKMEMSKN